MCLNNATLPGGHKNFINYKLICKSGENSLSNIKMGTQSPLVKN